MKSYKIGDIFFRRASPLILEYKVVCVREYSKEKQYELECQSCKHGEKCRVLAAFDNFKKLRIIHMLHDNEDYICEQRCWHDSDTPLYQTKDEVRRDILHATIQYYRDEIKKWENNLSSAKQSLSKHENSLAIIEAELQKGV